MTHDPRLKITIHLTIRPSGSGKIAVRIRIRITE